MNNNPQQELLNAAQLLEKAASMLEYANNLEKEASATADMLANSGVANSAQHEFYKDYFTKNPEKMASIKTAFNNLPQNNSAGALGEVVGGYTDNGGLDAFDQAVLNGF